MKTYHTVVRLEKVKHHNVKVEYLRLEYDQYTPAETVECYYTDGYSYPDTLSAVVVNQFTTEEE